MVFDAMWQGDRRIMTRRECYKWLQQIFDLGPRAAHIGLFTAEQCQVVVAAVEALRRRVIRDDLLNEVFSDGYEFTADAE